MGITTANIVDRTYFFHHSIKAHMGRDLSRQYLTSNERLIFKQKIWRKKPFDAFEHRLRFPPRDLLEMGKVIVGRSCDWEYSSMFPIFSVRIWNDFFFFFKFAIASRMVDAFFWQNGRTVKPLSQQPSVFTYLALRIAQALIGPHVGNLLLTRISRIYAWTF